MIPNPALTDILDLSDPTGKRRLALAGSRVVPKSSSSSAAVSLIRNANGNASVRLCRSSTRGYEDIDLANAVVTVAIGNPDQAPFSGTVPLAPLPPQTVGPLVAGKRYFIANFIAGDSFSNVGAAANATGQVFTATGTTPTVWTNGSSLQEITTELDVAATAAEVAAALNATAAITALGGVTVSPPSTLNSQLSTFRVTFNVLGPQEPIDGPIVANLSPASVVSVSRVMPGTDRVHEVQLIRLIALPFCVGTLGTPFPPAAFSVNEIQPPTQDLPQVKRLTLDPIPCDGFFLITLDSRPAVALPFNSTEANLAALAGPAYCICKAAENIWDIAGVEPAQEVALAVDVAGLVVPKGKTGLVPLNTDGIFQWFAQTAAKWGRFTREISIQFPGEEPHKFIDQIEFTRDLLDQGSLQPAVMTGLQFVASLTAGIPFSYRNDLTALRGGPFALESVDTTTLVLDTLYAFPIPAGGPVNSFKVHAGPADPDDPSGQVAPLNYHAVNNNKHWERSGL